MASVSKRMRDGNQTWWVRWRDPEGNQKSKTFTKKVDADKFRAEIESTLNRGMYLDLSLGQVAFEEWAEIWFTGQTHLKESTRVRYRGLLDTHVLTKWKKTPLNKIGHADVVTWIAELQRKTVNGRPLSPSTIRQAHRVLSLILTFGVRDNRLTRNVAEDIKLPAQVAQAIVFLDESELGQLIIAAGSNGIEIKSLALTGMRFGEFAGLDEKHFNRDSRMVNVCQNVTEVKGMLVWGSPKDNESRTIQITKGLAEDWIEHLGNRKGLIFPSKYGKTLRLNNWRRDVFDPAVESCGLAITPHDLRHTAASLAISRGANVKVVQKLLGHSKASITLDRYAALFPDDYTSVIEAMDSIALPLAAPQSESTQ